MQVDVTAGVVSFMDENGMPSKVVAANVVIPGCEGDIVVHAIDTVRAVGVGVAGRWMCVWGVPACGLAHLHKRRRAKRVGRDALATS